MCVCFRKFLVSDCTILKLHNDVAYTLHIYIYIYSKLSRSTLILDTLIQLEKSDKKRMKRIKISLLGMHFVVAVVVCVFWVESEYLNSQIYIYIYISLHLALCVEGCAGACVCVERGNRIYCSSYNCQWRFKDNKILIMLRKFFEIESNSDLMSVATWHNIDRYSLIRTLTDQRDIYKDTTWI